ncbi:DUF6509 family protein [Actinomycetes bacterium NPDC127524]|uniref:DUF6509 family protein n=1 Tax=Bacillus sp. OV322 TaxID=1882764 RepID=UPI0008E0ACD9|nr:DUF6509 family protein [Bacillus sp. OV322]SFC08444.1 hypothetical protein SAMN05443252_101799 [Bacillus sp. OV322]
MLTITSYTSEPLIDPFGILTGQRYEFFLDIEVPEDDELYSEKGLYIRVLYTIEETREGILKYDIHEKESEELLDFDLEEEEVKLLENFCKEHLS